MEKYQMSRGCRRPVSCGMPNAVPYTVPSSFANSNMNHNMNSNINSNINSNLNSNMDESMKSSAGCSMDSSCCYEEKTSMYTHLEHLPIAMAYVPCQKFRTPYDTCYALKAGTIFPDLCKPFCGKRGMMR